jgi:hypothetical protein
MVRTRIGLATLAFVLLSGFAFTEDEGGIPGALFRYGVGARSIGMGKAFTGVADEVDAIFYNPAGLGGFTKTDALAFGTQQFWGYRYGALGLATPVRKVGTFGVMVMYFLSPDVEEVSEIGDKTGRTFNHTQVAGMAAYSRKVFPFLSVGATAKFLYSRISTWNAAGFGADLGVLVTPLEWASAGISAVNVIRPKLKHFSLTEEFPLTLRFGLGIHPFRKLTVAFDVVQTEHQNTRFMGGAEFQATDLIRVRGGIDKNEVSGGVGLEPYVFGMNFRLDYTYTMHHASALALEDCHRISVNLKFGGYKVWATGEPEVLRIAPEGYNVVWINMHSFTPEPEKYWELRILRSTGETARIITGMGTPPLRVEWDARDESGRVVPVGRYNYELKVVDTNGNIIWGKGRLVSIKKIEPF